MNPHYKKPSEGFSLIELLVYIAIFSIVSASIWQAFIWFQKNHINFTQQQKISFDIDRVYDLLSKDILNTDPTQIIYNSNCLDFGNIKYYISVDNSSQKGTLYRSESCSPSDQKLLENISIDSGNFFVIGPPILDLQGNPILDLQGNPILDPNSKYKTITYSFYIQPDNKTPCCNTTRKVFSAFKQ